MKGKKLGRCETRTTEGDQCQREAGHASAHEIPIADEVLMARREAARLLPCVEACEGGHARSCPAFYRGAVAEALVR